jgi:hypothetical protein
MTQSNLKSIDKKSQAMLEFLVEHEQEVRRLFLNRELLKEIENPFNIRIEKNITLTNQVDDQIYNDFKDFCKEKKIKVKSALMRAMLDLINNYKDFNQD